MFLWSNRVDQVSLLHSMHGGCMALIGTELLAKVKELGDAPKSELVDALAAPRLSAAWTDVLFTALRRLMGIRFKLLVLMAAEVVGLSFYQLIATHLEPGGFRGALEQICQDEKDHLLFHADFFQSQLISALDRLVFRLLWPLISQLALAVACFDHRQTLSSLEIRRLMFLESGRRFISQTSDHCFSADSLLLRPERHRASAE
jgi:hypothetical protein